MLDSRYSPRGGIGRRGRQHRPKTAYRNGMVLFVAASAARGLAPSLPFLVVTRIVQATGTALVTPTSLVLTW